MKIADKFILKSYLGPMFATFFIVTFIILMNTLWRYLEDVVGKGLPFSAIAELMFYATGAMIPIGLPLATLLAAIMTMGQLGENNELLALKAAGVPLQRIIRPIAVVAVLVSISSFFVINNFVPYSLQKMRSIMFDISHQRQEIEFKDGVFFNGIPGISIRIGHQHPGTKKLEDVLIYDTRQQNVSKTIVADSGYITMADDKKSLKIILFHGQNYEDQRSFSWFSAPKLSHHIFSRQELEMKLEGFDFERSDDNSGMMKSSDSKNIVELQRDIDSLLVVADSALTRFVSTTMKEYIYSRDSLVVNNPDSVAQVRRTAIVVSGRTIDTLSTELQDRIFSNVNTRLTNMRGFLLPGHDDIMRSTSELYKSKVDWHKKLSLPVSVIVFFLIGAPLGAIIRKGGLGMPIVIAVFFFIVYYIITISGEKMVRDGAWTPIVGIWMPILILFPIAVFLTYKAATDSQLLSLEAYINNYKKAKVWFREHIWEPAGVRLPFLRNKKRKA